MFHHPILPWVLFDAMLALNKVSGRSLAGDVVEGLQVWQLNSLWFFLALQLQEMAFPDESMSGIDLQ